MEQTKSYAGNHVQNTDGVGTLDQQTKEWLNQVYEKIETKLEWVSEKSKDKIPYLTINGEHDDRSDLSKKWNENDGLNWWTNGFWGGILWMLYHATGKEPVLQKLHAFPRKKWMPALMIIMDFIMMLDLCGDQPQQLTMI